jgi:hypothetical protein
MHCSLGALQSRFFLHRGHARRRGRVLRTVIHGMTLPFEYGAARFVVVGDPRFALRERPMLDGRKSPEYHRPPRTPPTPRYQSWGDITKLKELPSVGWTTARSGSGLILCTDVRKTLSGSMAEVGKWRGRIRLVSSTIGVRLAGLIKSTSRTKSLD